MPSKSPAQHRYMEMIAHGGTPNTGGGPSKAVAQDFVRADTRVSHRGKKSFTGRKHAQKAGY